MIGGAQAIALRTGRRDRSLEFVGRRTGWTVAERLTAPAYVAWSLWLIATGVVLL